MSNYSSSWNSSVNADLARPDLPRPTCRVRLVCGPPAAGKTTYVCKHAAPADIVIDFEGIARELGHDRNVPSYAVADVLLERNERLAALADEPRHRLAWVIINAPSKRLRQWWRATLGVAPGDLIVLSHVRNELVRRILTDPTRVAVRQEHIKAVDQWFRQERANDPGVFRGDCDDDGIPLDPLHPWNRNWKG